MTKPVRAGTGAARPASFIRSRALALVLTVGLMAIGLAAAVLPDSLAQVNAPGFSDNVMFTGLDGPTSFQFSADGRVFVAEKSGLVKVFDSLSDPTADVFVDLRTQVHNWYDRGLLGLALAPTFPADPHVYVLYAHDAAIGATAPRWGTAGETSDPCPNDAEGCLISGRLSRFLAMGNTAGPEQVLIEDWCAQFPSHTIGDLHFGPDGALYVSGGEGASFTFTDYGQVGANVCHDYPYDPNQTVPANLTMPDSRGGSLRSQKVITDGVHVSLDGAILRVDPATGEGLPSNPYASSSDANARRIIASGLRNPFRFGVRPGTQELYVGDVGANTWEEINVVANAGDGVAENFGWPCYEGDLPYGSFQSLGATLCNNLYAAGTAKTALYKYKHGDPPVPGDDCGPGGGDSTSGIAFNDNSNNYPAEYDGAMFFADVNHSCIWVMSAGTDGKPDPTTARNFMHAGGVVYLATGPEGDLWFADINGGNIHRISFGSATPITCPAGQYVAEYFNNRFMNGAPALYRCETVIDNDYGGGGPAPGINADQFAVRWTKSPVLAAGSYDFTATADDGVRVYVDDVLIIDQWHDQPATTYTATRSLTAGSHKIVVEYYDNGAAAVAKFSYGLTGGGANQAPTPTIDTPTVSTTWKVGDPIFFGGSATDPEDGDVSASAVWRVSILHCPALCHEHLLQTFTGAAGAGRSIVAPDHDYPTKLQFQLTATDSQGRTTTATRVIDPQTATLRFESVPNGLTLTHGTAEGVTPFERTVVLGSANSVGALTPQTLSGTTYDWTSWSDGGTRSHNVTAGAGVTTFTATFTGQGGGDPGTCTAGQFLAEYFNNQLLFGTPVLSRCETAINNDWAGGSPGPGVNADGFSVRWTGSHTFSAGPYLFTTTADDGVRVFVDGTSLIDQWHDQGATTYTATRTLTAGAHVVRMEFYENGGGALAKLSWANTGPPVDPPPDPGTCTAGQFLAEYFNNQLLFGTPVLSRCETAINNDWAGGSPGPGVNADGFSVRWTGSHTFSAGPYLFTTTADDGVRVFVDGTSLIDQWHDQGATTYTATRTLTAGAHVVRMEFYENGGGALAKLSWANTGPPVDPPPDPGTCTAGQFLAEYFNNQLLFGTPVLSRCETAINNDWAGGSPGPGVNADGFSVRWTGSHTFSAGPYLFTTTADDGVRVFVDGTSLIDQWHDQGATTYTATRTLTAGAHVVRMEFYENGGGALAKLSWANTGPPVDPPPDPGTCSAGQFLAEYFNNQLLFGTPVLSRCETAINNDWAGGSPGPGVNADGFSVRWTGSHTFSAGPYLFTTTADDGVRVFVDGTSLIDQWHDQGATTYTATRTLTAGAHVVRMEFYENGGGALAKLSWANTGPPVDPPPDPGTCTAGQFLAEYFNNQLLFGTPVLSRCETAINNDWAGGSPGPGVNADGFSVRWTGSHTFSAGPYLFTTTADDGVRVFVDGTSLIDQWHDQGATTYTATRTLTAGAHVVRMEFYENGGGALAKLSWTGT